MLASLETQLRALYDIEGEPIVTEHLCDEDIARALVGRDISRQEILIVREVEGEPPEVGLFLSQDLLQQLACLPEASFLSYRGSREENQALASAIEGISHLLLVAFRNHHGQAVSELELELQAEVDKFAGPLCAELSPQALTGYGVGLVRSLTAKKHGHSQDPSSHPRHFSRELRHTLFESVRFYDAAQSERGQRYRFAHRLASRYAHSLERRHLARGSVALGGLEALRRELRRFFRLGFRQKRELIAQL